MWRKMVHWGHMVEHRAELALELQRARRNGYPVPAEAYKRLRSRGGQHDLFIYLLRFLDPRKSTLLVDVGGNTGYWCQDFLHYFPNTSVIAFEPGSRAYEQYRRRFAANGRVQVHQCAISDQVGQAQFNIGESLSRSSLNNYADTQAELGIKFVGSETVKLDRLDHYPVSEQEASQRVLKIDVQGHELQALQGAAACLHQMSVVLVEVSFAPEYEGTDPSFAHVCAFLLNYGLYPAIFGEYGRERGPYAFERDVLFCRYDNLKNIYGW